MRVRLPRILDELEHRYGRPPAPPSHDPFELVLWENVAYLVNDRRREKAFRALKQSVGTRPEQILSAERDDLLRVAELGGMHPDRRVDSLREAARIALDELQGDLKAVGRWPLAKAVRALRKFPGIGAPGAEKILLFSLERPLFALESNGLRALVRLGFGREQKSYASTYRSVKEATVDQIVTDCSWLIRARELLRRHGQELCKHNQPLCEACTLKRGCHHFENERS